MEKEEYYLRLLEDVNSCFVDIFQSGFDTIGDGTLGEVARLSALANKSGMSYLSKLCNEFEKKVRSNRLVVAEDDVTLTNIYFEIINYIKKAKSKVTYDNVKKQYFEE